MRNCTILLALSSAFVLGLGMVGAAQAALVLNNGNFDADGPIGSPYTSCTGWTRTAGNGIWFGTAGDLSPDTSPNQALLNTRDGSGIGTEFTSDVLTGAFVPGTIYTLDYKFGARGVVPTADRDLFVEIVGSSDGVLATSGDLQPLITSSGTYFSGSLPWDSTGVAAQDFTVVLRAAGATNQQFGFDSLELTVVPEPSSLALAAFGLGSAFCGRRRRR